MITRSTVGKLMIEDALPEEMRGRNITFDKKNMSTLLKELADKHPDKYVDVTKKLSDIGRQVATETGGYSIGLSHLKQAAGTKKTINEIRQKLTGFLADTRLNDKQRNEAIIRSVGGYQQSLMDDVYKEGLAAKNPIAMQIMSGSRGNKMNLSSLLGSDLLYEDHRGDIIPVPVLKSYSQGLTPAEYWAGTYGARKSIISTKFATADAGFFGKQLNQVTHRLSVVDQDDPRQDLGVRGLPVDTDDMDNEGALLAQDFGGYKRNTVLTPKILKDLKARDFSRILVRSPMTGGSPDGGVYARDVGVRERGTLPGRGEMVGMTAAQAIAEPISQGQLCLAEGTLVRMADWSVKAIEDIQPGEQVIGADKTGVLFPVSVVRRYYNGVRECVRTTFSAAKTKERVTLVSTIDHKLLANARRWHPETELIDAGIWPVGEKCVRLCAVMPRAVHHDGGTIHEPAALLLGLLLGDGCYTESVHGVHLSCFDPTLVADIAPLLTTLQLKATLLAGQKGYYRLSQLKDTIRQCVITGKTLAGDRNPIVIKLKELGLYGKYAHEKTLPAGVWTWDKDSVLNLIAGLLATDGSVYTCVARNVQNAYYVGYCSTSLTLINELRELLRVRFAVYAGPIHSQSKSRKRALYSFTITRQQEVSKLRTLLADRIPGRKRTTLNGVNTFTSSVDTNFFYRQEQETLGDLPTYDIEVNHPDHLFVLANGLIVSNSAKHSGGVAGQEKTVGGFQYINQLIQVPKTFKGGAAHTTVDGRVQKIEDAPAGGKYVFINDKPQYVGSGFDLKVKPGDDVEAGDIISDGMPNPSIITEHKGIGEGRKYFVKAFRDSMGSMGLRSHRRNIELIGRGLIDHVRMTEEYGDHVPDDVIPYSTLEHGYKPREGFQTLEPSRALNKYLEKPVLHYSIGTKVRPGMLKDMQYFGIKDITVHDKPAPFQPEMVRAMYNLHHDPDWMTRMYGSGLKSSLLDATHRGSTSSATGTSFVPGLAKSVDFGRVGQVRQSEPGLKPDLNTPVATPMTPNTDTEKLSSDDILPQQHIKFAEVYTANGDSVQGVGLRKLYHALLDEKGISGLGVNNEETGNVELAFNGDEAQRKNVFDELATRIQAKTGKPVTFAPLAVPQQMTPVNLSNADAARLNAIHHLAYRMSNMYDPSDAAMHDDATFKQNMADRFRLAVTDKGLTGTVPSRAAEQLLGTRPMYSAMAPEYRVRDEDEAMKDMAPEHKQKLLSMLGTDRGFLSNKTNNSKLASDDILPGGIGDKYNVSDFSKKEMAKGVKTESEHTTNPAIAADISKDHLVEDPKYYTKLEKVEKKSAYSIADGIANVRRKDDTLSQLLEAKKHSDAKRYDHKNAILRKLMRQSPQDWVVDDADAKHYGVTHVPTSFKLHTDPNVIPPEVTRQKQAEVPPAVPAPAPATPAPAPNTNVYAAPPKPRRMFDNILPEVRPGAKGFLHNFKQTLGDVATLTNPRRSNLSSNWDFDAIGGSANTTGKTRGSLPKISIPSWGLSQPKTPAAPAPAQAAPAQAAPAQAAPAQAAPAQAAPAPQGTQSSVTPRHAFSPQDQEIIIKEFERDYERPLTPDEKINILNSMHLRKTEGMASNLIDNTAQSLARVPNLIPSTLTQLGASVPGLSTAKALGNTAINVSKEFPRQMTASMRSATLPFVPERNATTTQALRNKYTAPNQLQPSPAFPIHSAFGEGTLDLAGSAGYSYLPQSWKGQVPAVPAPTTSGPIASTLARLGASVPGLSTAASTVKTLGNIATAVPRFAVTNPVAAAVLDIANYGISNPSTKSIMLEQNVGQENWDRALDVARNSSFLENAGDVAKAVGNLGTLNALSALHPSLNPTGAGRLLTSAVGTVGSLPSTLHKTFTNKGLQYFAGGRAYDTAMRGFNIDQMTRQHTLGTPYLPTTPVQPYMRDLAGKPLFLHEGLKGYKVPEAFRTAKNWSSGFIGPGPQNPLSVTADLLLSSFRGYLDTLGINPAPLLGNPPANRSDAEKVIDTNSDEHTQIMALRKAILDMVLDPDQSRAKRFAAFLANLRNQAEAAPNEISPAEAGDEKPLTNIQEYQRISKMLPLGLQYILGNIHNQETMKNSTAYRKAFNADNPLERIVPGAPAATATNSAAVQASRVPEPLRATSTTQMPKTDTAFSGLQSWAQDDAKKESFQNVYAQAQAHAKHIGEDTEGLAAGVYDDIIRWYAERGLLNAGPNSQLYSNVIHRALQLVPEDAPLKDIPFDKFKTIPRAPAETIESFTKLDDKQFIEQARRLFSAKDPATLNELQSLPLELVKKLRAAYTEWQNYAPPGPGRYSFNRAPTP